jgi:hypothetical protein
MRKLAALPAIGLVCATPAFGQDWKVSTGKSPIDDSQFVRAKLTSEDGRSFMRADCEGRNTDVAVAPAGFLHCTSRDDIRVIYRFGQKPAVESLRWVPSANCRQAFAPSAVDLLKSMKDDERMFVRVYDRRGQEYDATFNLGSVSKVRDQIAATCRWKVSAKPTK